MLGNWMRIITLIENSTKGEKCHKTKEQLFEDYFNSKGFIIG